MAAVEADRADFAGREHAIEQLLGLGRKGADLVEQQGAAVGLDQLAGLGARTRPGRRPSRGRTARCRRCWRGSPCSRATSSGPLARRLAAWIARASVSLPVPGSPMIRTGRRLRADLAATASAARNSGAAPISCSSASVGASFSDTGASSPAARRRSALAASASSSRSGRDRADQEIGRAGAHRLDGDRKRCRRATSTMTGRFGAVLAQRGDQLRALSRVPAAEQRGLHFAAVRPLKQRERHLLVGGADHAPAGARGDGRNQPALVGDWRRAAAAIVSVLRACWPFADHRRRAVKAGLRTAALSGAWERAVALLWTRRARMLEEGECMAEDENRCWPTRRRRTWRCTCATMRASPGCSNGARSSASSSASSSFVILW